MAIPKDIFKAREWLAGAQAPYSWEMVVTSVEPDPGTDWVEFRMHHAREAEGRPDDIWYAGYLSYSGIPELLECYRQEGVPFTVTLYAFGDTSKVAV